MGGGDDGLADLGERIGWQREQHGRRHEGGGA